MLNITGMVMMIVGVLMMAGSAGDCDGKCMEYANTFSEKLIAVFIGFAMFGTGIFILFKSK